MQTDLNADTLMEALYAHLPGGAAGHPFARRCIEATLAAARAPLLAQIADFHMAYRLKCDEETKALHAELERLRSERDAAAAALRSVCRHWNEFGPEHGFGECIDHAESALDRLASAPLPTKQEQT